MLVVENFLLIALDPKLGTTVLPRHAPRIESLCAAAVLVDLADIGHLALHGTYLWANTEFPLTHPLLEQAVAAMGPQSRPPANAIATVARRMSSLPARVAEGLVRRDVLHSVRQTRWLVLKKKMFPLRSVQARNTAVETLRSAAHAGPEDLRGLALLQLVDAGGVLPEFLDAHDHEAAERRLIALNRTDANAPETLRILAAIRSALLDG